MSAANTPVATKPMPIPRRRPAALLPTFENYAYGQGAEYSVFAHKHKSTTRSPAVVATSWRSRDAAMASLSTRKHAVPIWERRGAPAPTILGPAAPPSPMPRIYSPEELIRLSASPLVHVKEEWHAPLADAAQTLLSGPQCKPRPRRRRQRALRSAASTASASTSSSSSMSETSSVASFFDKRSLGGSSFPTSAASSADGSAYECSSRSSSPSDSEEEGEGDYLPSPPQSAKTTAW